MAVFSRIEPGLKKSLTPVVDEEWTRLPPSLATECLEAVERPDTTDVSMSLGGPRPSLSCVQPSNNSNSHLTHTHLHPPQQADDEHPKKENLWSNATHLARLQLLLESLDPSLLPLQRVLGNSQSRLRIQQLAATLSLFFNF